MMLKRLPRVTALSALLVLVWVGVSSSAPGSGTASIAPSGNVVVGTTGEWSVTYTATEAFNAGTLRLTIPGGWTAPQSTNATSAGYVTVATNEPTGNPLLSVGGSEITITVDTLSAGNTITIVYGDDAGGSSARATAATTPGSDSFIVESDPLGGAPSAIAGSPSLTVVVGPPSYLTFAPSDTTVTAGDYAQYRLFVFDEFNNRAPVPANRTVNLFPAHGLFYAAGTTTPSIANVVIPAGQSTVRIDYRATLATAGTPHSLTAITASGSPTLAAFDQVNVVAGPLSTTNSLISATSPKIANGIDQSSVTVTSRDQFGNPRQGDDVTLGVTGSAVKVDPLSQTGANGQASGVVTNTVAEPVTVSASINTQLIVPTALVTFQAGPVSALTSSVEATTPVVANGIATSTITVTARDANNNPVSGRTVVLAVAPLGDVVLTQPGGVTNSLGQVTGTLSSTVPGLRTVTATIAGTPVTDDAVVDFTSGPVASFQWTVDGNGVAGVFESVTLRARDAQGNTVIGYTGTVNLSTTSGGVGNGVVEWASPDAIGTITNLVNDTATFQFAAADSGTAILRVTDTRAETMQLEAQAGAATGVSGSIVVVANVADKVLLDAGNGQSATVFTQVATPPRVRIMDQFDNPVAGQQVTFRLIAPVTATVDVVAGGGVDSTGVSGADGRIDCDVWRLNQLVGTNRLRALIPSGSIPSVDFTATGTADVGAGLVLAPTSQNVTVGSFTVVTATLTDQYGNRRAGTRVDVAITDGADGTLVSNPAHTTTQLTPTARWGTSDVNGQITVQYAAPAGASLSDVVDGSTSTIPQSAVTDAVYTTTASGATDLRITFVGPSTELAGQSFEFLVEAVDGNGNPDPTSTASVTLTPEALSTLVFSLSDFGATVTSFDLVGGERTIYGRGTKSGDWEITVDDGVGGLGPDTDVVTITDTGVIDHYVVTTVPSVVAGATFDVTVRAEDAFDNTVVGASNVVNLQAIDDITTNPALSTLLVGQTTLSNGFATQAETYTRAEAIRVRASAAGREGTSGVLTVSAAPAYRIAKISGDNTGVSVGAPQLLVAQVLDNFDNPVANEPVSFIVLDGGGSVPAPPVNTDAAGNASTTLTTGVAAGDNRVKAFILDENPAGLERIDYLVETVPGGIAYFEVVPAKLNPVAGEPVNVVVTAFDASDNPVSGDNTTQIQLTETGSAQFGAATGTLTGGVFSTTVTDTVAESFTITAVRQGGGPSGTSAPVVVSNDIAYRVVKVSGDASGVTAGGAQPLEVEVRDRYGNTVASSLVTFAVASSPGGASIADLVGDPGDGITTTDASGRAQATLTTSAIAGANVVNAQILDANPLALERVVFTVNTDANSATALRITFLGPTTRSAGQSSSFKVEALDASQNLDTANGSLVTLTPEALSTLEFSLTDFGSTVTQFNLVNGTRTIFVRGTKTGNWDITATSAPLAPDTDVLNVTDTGVVESYAVSAPAGAVAGAPFNVVIEARDAFGNKVLGAGNLVNLAAVEAADSTTLTGVALSPAQATVVGGAVVANETYTRAEGIRVRVRDGGGKEGFSAVVLVGSAPAYTVVNVSGSGGGVVAGTNQILTAQVRDAFNNPVQNQTVSFSVVSGGGSILPLNVQSDAAGNAVATLTTGTIVGSNTARAQILDGNPANLERADFIVSTIPGPVAYYVVTPVSTALVANEVTNVTVRGRDANNNTVTLDNSTVVNLSHTGSATLGDTQGTLTAGLFTTTVRDTVAETFTVSATSGVPVGTSAAITVSAGAPYRIVKVTADPVNGLPVGTAQPLVSEVRDQWSNPVGAGVVVTHLIVQAPDASADLTDTVGDPGDGITTTAANGQATVDLRTADTAGLNQVSATILDGNPVVRERVTYDVNTVAGGIAYYEVDMGVVTTVVAGTTTPVTIRAFDNNDNPVDDDVTQVDLSGDPGIGLIFGTNPVTLADGVAVTTVRANQVQLDYRVRARSVGQPTVTGLGDPVDVTPAPPAGVITATATADTITANGIATTTLTSSVITDQFGNQVPAGGGVNVSTTNGVILGVQPKIIGANGRIAFDLRSSTTPGTATVTMTTVLGAPATGQKVIHFAEPVTFTSTAAPVPSIIRPGDNVRFRVVVNNTSDTRANLTTASRFTFSDGTRTFDASLAATKSVAPLDTATLVFNTTALDAAFTADFYTPGLTLVGSDEYGAAFNVASTLPANSVQVTSIEITLISAPPQVSRGQIRTVGVSVRNNGAANATLTGINLSYIPGVGDYTPGTPSPALPLVITPGNTVVVNIPVTIETTSGLGTDQIDGFAQATVGGQPVSDNSVAPHPVPSWEILAQANLTYVPGTLAPVAATRGKSYAFALSIQNSGSGVVSLNPATTRLTFTDGTFSFSAAPSQAYAIAGNTTQPMTFVATLIPAGFTTGPRDVVLDARGTENGAPFTQLVTAPGALTVVTPAVLSAVAGTLQPTVTTKGSTAAFTINVNNTGGATVNLVPVSTTISFLGFSAQLSPASDLTVSPGVTTLTFTPTTVGAGVTPGSYAPQIGIVDAFENGLDYDASFPSPTSVLVQDAPDVAISAILSSQPAITTDQALPVTMKMVVTNNGSATYSFTSASLRLFSGAQERTAQFAISTPAGFMSGGNLAPASTDTVLFTIADAAGAMAPGSLVIEGLLNVEDVNTSDDISANTNNGGKGALLVQTPAVFSILAVTPSQSVVTASMTRPMTIRVAVKNNGQSDADVLLAGNAALSFTPMLAGWVRTVRPALAGGGVTLSGGEVDTVIFDVTQAGSITGLSTVSATLNGTELNSGRSVNNTSPTPGAIEVESPGDIDVTSVVSSRANITSGGSASWTLTVSVQNPGEAAVDLNLGNAVAVDFGGASIPPVPVIPLSLAGGGRTLSGGESDQFVITVPNAGTYSAFGPQNMSVLVTGTEINSGDGRSGGNFDAVTVQAAPAVAYVSVGPSPVAKGVSVPFAVIVRNPVANGATLTLDRATTRLRFAGSSFDAGLSPASPVDMPAGQDVTLLFTSTVVPGGTPSGAQNDAELVLNWTHNGNTGNATVPVTDGDIVVEDAPELGIVSLVASRGTVTVGQTAPSWTVVMTVRNLGGLPVVLNLDVAKTHLLLNLLNGGADVTSEYTIVQPTELENAGGTTLAAGMTDALTFTVTEAGVSTGTVIIAGNVTGNENSLEVTGNTDAGGTGSFVLQTPAALAIRSVTPARTTATVGQTATYKIRMAVENTGQAAAAVILSKPNTDLTFSGSGWATSLAPTLAGVDNVLSGGEVDTVTFTVTTTGSPAGVATIDGNVSGTELNTGTLKVDDTLDAGTGSITLQDAAVLAIQSVTPSRSTVTQSSGVPWFIDVVVANTGGAPARLTLPGGVSAAVQDGVVPFAPVTGFQGGGDIIQPGVSRTLVFSTNATGAFASFGLKPITINLNGVDTNSGAPLNAFDNSAAITVQTAPNLQVVSIEPDTVTSGSNAFFRVLIANPGANAATAVLDRASTRISFASDAYSAFLDLASVTSLPGDATTEVVFEDKTVAPSIVRTQHDVDVRLAYTANAVTTPLELETVASGVTVQDAPTLSIEAISVENPTVTAGQTAPWTATMTISNNGTQDIALDLSPARTSLTFIAPGAVPDNGYTVVPPVALLSAGTGTLAAGATDQLVFTITQTGSLTGIVTVNGRAAGLVGGTVEVSDDTFSGGRGFVNVQSAAAVTVSAIHTTQPRVTAGQTADWGVRVILANSGSADVTVDLAGAGITFDGSITGWTRGPATLLGGGTTLEGGAVDSLLFNIDVTSATSGTPRIDATVPFTEINTSTPGTANTLAAGFGSVIVETPPRVRIATTTLLAPNAPNVNTAQSYSIAVEVQNTGEAAARDIAVSVASPSGFNAIPGVAPIALVAGGQTVLLQLPATASSAGSETLTATVDSLRDVNSGDIVASDSPLDNTTPVTVQAPAQFAVTGVRPSQASVTQGQSNPWNVIVTLENAGGADLDLTAPADDDLGFSIQGSTEIDYVVVPPTAFASGRPAWRLAGGAVDSLVYSIVSTGADAGTVDISLGTSGTDRNQPAVVLPGAGATSVVVQPAAGLAIVSTVSVGTVNHATANRDTVNTGFAYQMHVTVQNRGETVDSVLVSLTTDDGSNVAPASLVRQSIDADASHTFVYNITAPASTTPLETFLSSILPGVISHNSGQPVTPEPAVDNTQIVVTETPADLRTTLVITSPPGATGGTVSVGQTFQMTARVTNFGQANLSGPAQVTLTLPATGGVFGVAEPLVRTFVAGQPIVWNVTAPAAQQAAENFTCAITTTPIDANNGLAASASVPSAQRAVTVSEGGALAAQSVAIIAPAGAQDDTVSVTQNFTLRALVTPSDDTDAVVATLTLPAGFSVVGSSVRNLGDGTGAQKQADYNIIAPSLPGAAADVFVTFTGTDANSGDPVLTVADTVAVTTVARASLGVTASVTAPADATDNTVGVGTPFTVTATVANIAGAAGIGAPGTLSIALPAGYTGDSASKPFTVGQPVQWILTSPGQPQGPDQINVSISVIPPDENSGAAAQVTIPTAAIAMVTEGSAVAVTDVSGSLGIDPRPVPGGADGVELLGFRIAYNATDSNVPSAEIETIAITVVDKDGAPLGDGALAGTLKRLTVDLGGAQPYEVVDPSANPVVVDLTAGGSDRLIAPNAFATAIVGVDLASSPRVTEFSVGIRTGGLVVRDPGSGQELGITDGNGRPLDGQVTSEPLIVLSSNFEEYVHNYPNPFRAGSQETRIAYFLDQAATVTIRIFSISGELVWEENIPSSDARAQAGPQEATWDGRNGSGEVVRNGVYVCVLNAGSKSTKFNIAVAK